MKINGILQILNESSGSFSVTGTLPSGERKKIRIKFSEKAQKHANGAEIKFYIDSIHPFPKTIDGMDPEEWAKEQVDRYTKINHNK